MCQNKGLQPDRHEHEPPKIKLEKEMRFGLLVHTKAEIVALGGVRGILGLPRPWPEAGNQPLGVVHGPPEARHGILEVEQEPLGVRRAKLEAGNPRRDPENLPPGVEHPKPEAGNPAHGVEYGKLEAQDEPLELGNQRLELEKKKVDSARRPRRVGGGALDQGDGAGLGQDSGPGRAGHRPSRQATAL